MHFANHNFNGTTAVSDCEYKKRLQIALLITSLVNHKASIEYQCFFIKEKLSLRCVGKVNLVKVNLVEFQKTQTDQMYTLNALYCELSGACVNAM